MTDHPTEPVSPAEDSGRPGEPTSPPPAYPPPPPAAVAAEPRRIPRPGPEFWWAGAAAAAVVLVACAGFLVGRASVDGHDHPQQQIQRQFPHLGTPQQLPGQ